ncbi:adenylyl-sulfate kinase [Psychroflexus salis]|uniref:Adenylyl-sulfate kinase n=1 Tax=Psychroflexus salis TaxID=1526574 RepID=A0A917A2F2_9FLAO|nr:adenylyl-sulfate kinase [Psychroflexus salis]GGE22037.1 adenylyl-sulfate kinase [Psychroflexus salis]
MSKNIVFHNYDVQRKDRNTTYGHPSFVLWFTGLSGSGKSTIANQVEKVLFESGKKCYSLDGDNIRTGLNKGLGFTETDRRENLRRIAEVAKLFVNAGNICIAAFVSPLIEDRKQVEEIIGTTDFYEIFVDTHLEECEKRDVKGLYKKARAGEIRNFTGISAPYEAPKHPALHIQTKNKKITESVQEVLNFLNDKLQ